MGQRLLIVDSDRRFIQDHQVALEAAFEVECLFSAEGVMPKLESGQFAAVLLCVEVSDNKGYALCSAIRRHPQLADIKIVLISAKATEEEYSRHQSLRGRADAYLHKPMDSITLVTHLSPFVPVRPVDPDNPLGDLFGADLGEEWLESLKAEIDVEDLAAPPKNLTPPAPPIPEPPIPAQPIPRVAVEMPLIQPPSVVSKDAGKIALLEARILDLEAKLQSQSEFLSTREQEIEHLHSAQEHATRNLDEALRCRTELGDLEQKLSDSEEALLAQESRATRAETEAAHLQEKLEDIERAQEETQTRLAAMDSQIAELSTAKAQAESRCLDLDSALENLRMEASKQAEQAGEYQDLSKQIQAQEAQLQELQKQLEASNQAIEASNQALGERTQESESLKVDIAGLEGTLRGQRRELADQSGRMGSLTRECEAMLVKVSEGETRVRELEGTLSEKQESLQAAHIDASELRQRLESLQLDLAGKNSELASLSAEKDAKFQALSNEKQTQFEAFQAETGQLRERLDGIATALAEKESLIEAGRLETAQLSQNIEYLNLALSRKDQELSQLITEKESQQQALMQTLNARETELNQLGDTLNSLRERIAESERSQREAEGHLNEKSARLEALGEAIADLESGIRRASDLTRPV